MPSTDPQSLSALADGELDADAAERLRRRIDADASAAAVLRDVHRLTAAARRAVRARTPPASQALRARLTSLADAESPAARPRPSAWRVFLPQAAAAVLLLGVGAWIGHRAVVPAPIGPGGPAAASDVLPAAVISQAEEVHGFCSRLAEGLHSAGYPTELAPLATSVERDLHGDHPYPDLTSIGYRYRGAGPCGLPMGDTVHLLYRSLKPGSVNAVSVFVQPWHGQYALDANRLYAVSVASSPFPMLAWRTERVVYFLLADDAKTLRAAATLIRGTPATGI